MNLKKIMFIFVFICMIIFGIFYYNFFYLGNNIISRSQEEIVDNILNDLSYYEADITVKVISNKNENYYNMYQIVDNEYSKCTINSPDSIKGLSIELGDGKLKISNAKLNMEKTYDNYELILNNSLFLNVFINDYKNNESKNYEENDYIVFSSKLNNNHSTYIKYKELYVDKKTGIPKELIIKDNTKKTCISIIYNDIKIK